MFAFGKPNFRLSGQKLFLDFKNAFKIAEKYHAEALCAEAVSYDFAKSETWRCFLDDNPKNIDEVKTRFPEVPVVEVKRPNSKYQTVLSKKADLVVDRLDWPLRLRKSG